MRSDRAIAIAYAAKGCSDIDWFPAEKKPPPRELLVARNQNLLPSPMYVLFKMSFLDSPWLLRFRHMPMLSFVGNNEMETQIP